MQILNKLEARSHVPFQSIMIILKMSLKSKLNRGYYIFKTNERNCSKRYEDIGLGKSSADSEDPNV